jgi:hypothetical protein
VEGYPHLGAQAPYDHVTTSGRYVDMARLDVDRVGGLDHLRLAFRIELGRQGFREAWRHVLHYEYGQIRHSRELGQHVDKGLWAAGRDADRYYLCPVRAVGRRL